MQEEATREAWKILRENVDRGEKFLDKERPGWYKNVNLSDFDMKDGHRCICGWVFKDMVGKLFASKGLGMIDSGFQYLSYEYSTVHPSKHGFLSDGLKVALGKNQQYSMLAELWTKKIEKRLANDGLLGA